MGGGVGVDYPTPLSFHLAKLPERPACSPKSQVSIILFLVKVKSSVAQREPNPFYIPLYWLVDRDTHNGLL